MDNWHPNIVHQMALDRHREDIARGEANHRLAAALGARSLRAHLTRALIALANHIDPARPAQLPAEPGLAPSTPL